jgi:hypothetical protein
MPIAALAGLVWGPNVLQLVPEIGDPEKVHIAVRRLLSFILIVMRCVVLGFGKPPKTCPSCAECLCFVRSVLGAFYRASWCLCSNM